MKAALLPLLLILGACAPKAIVVEEPAAPIRKETAPEPAPEMADLPGHDDGLLAPSGLLGMPSDDDMKATADPADKPGTTVIATPPAR